MANRYPWKSLLIAGLVCASFQTALAAVKQRTVYSYFPVRGATAGTIYRSVTANSEMKGSHETLATTGVSMNTVMLTTKGPSCKVARIDVALDFKVRLPRLQNEAALPAGLRRDWRGFAAHLKWHEEHHRALWMACARSYHAALQPLMRRSCGDLKGQMNSLWNQAEKACHATNAAFDIQDEGAVRNLPFSRRVLSGN